MTDRELMQQALDALVEVEQTLKQISAFKIYPKYYEAIEALRARLAQPEQQHSEQWWKHEVSNAWAEGYEKGRASVKQPEQEPVACPYCHYSHTLGAVFFDQNCAGCVNRMTTPPQREWQGLTDEEMFSLWVRCPAETEDRFAFARAIEQALKEKNT